MNPFTEEMFVLFAILALGAWIGRWSWRGISLGTAGVLFVALLFGHFGMSVPKEAEKRDNAAAALLGFRLLRERGNRISVIFKDVRAEFLKRAEADVHFACEQGGEIRALLDRADASGERENLPVRVVATVPSRFGDEPVATFELTLSFKRR